MQKGRLAVFLMWLQKTKGRVHRSYSFLKRKKKNGVIVCFEGIDGCGKSTQIKMLSDALTKKGIPHQVIKHPGQTEFGKQLRELILRGVQPTSDTAHRLLFWADLAETVNRYKANQLLIFDRHPSYSNYAYGSGMPGFSKKLHVALDVFFGESYPSPDITFVIDVPVNVAFARIRERGLAEKFDDIFP